MHTLYYPLRSSIFAAGLALFVGGHFHASAETLPLDAKNSTLTFVGDSFMHAFHGEAKDFTGSAAGTVSI